MRIGQGIDIHAFAEGRRLMLGGVEIPHTHGLDGHSDGDALLHAIIDAMLGAAGLGDIGGMFPSTDDQFRGASSLGLLAQVYEHVSTYGYVISNMDCTIVVQEPRIAPHVPAMRAAIASALRLDVTNVNVKATTSDTLGFTGRREGVAAFAVVLLQ